MVKRRELNYSYVQEDRTELPDFRQVQLPPQINKWRRIWKGPQLMHFNRLLYLLVFLNVFVFAWGLGQNWWWSDGAFNLAFISNLAVLNITSAILIRQQLVINALFKMATSAPVSWPLSVRRLLGKVYHFGGIHVGGALMGTLWYAFFLVALNFHYFNGIGKVSLLNVSIPYLTTGVLILMMIMAKPNIRAKYHDNFELMHRFGGWASLILFWIHTLVFIQEGKGELAFSTALFSAIEFWCLLAITISVVLPWLRLKKVRVDIESPSSHVALAKFNYGVTPFAGSSTALSRDPLREWHSFANIPSPDEDGFRLTISRAGDWTGKFIDDKPEYVWVKGIPTAGVGNIDQLFKKVVWVATGSGIGPCLPHLLSQETPSRLVWATRNPRKTYGDHLVDEILEVQPSAIIWDTDAHGKPDLVKLAYLAYQEFDAEAIICISNKKLTWQVVYGMESRNIPAYGAIWDS